MWDTLNENNTIVLSNDTMGVCMPAASRIGCRPPAPSLKAWYSSRSLLLEIYEMLKGQKGLKGVMGACRKRKASSKEAEVMTELHQQLLIDTAAAQPAAQSSTSQQP